MFDDVMEWIMDRWWTAPLFIVILISVAVLIAQPWKPKPLRPCSDYADYAMQDVPARCIKEFQK